MTPDLSRYFDNAATTPVDPLVVEEMLPFMRGGFGNANSIHAFGQRAHAAVELARIRVAALIGADDPAQIIFTSGATESNNQVLRSFSVGAVSPFEHSAIREPAKQLGFGVLPNDGYCVSPPAEHVELLSLMTVNNEIGTIWEPASLSEYADFVHSDITQAVGKVPLTLDGMAFASFSAHKFYGPKGVGALYYRDYPPKALMVGGEQENALRGGTLNVPGIVGMGLAAALAEDEMESSLQLVVELRAVLLDGLRDCTDWRINGGNSVSPYILSLSFLGIEGETLVIEVDRMGFAISSGAACSSHSREPSHVLEALHVDEAWARGTVRISFGKYCTADGARDLSKSLRQAVEMLRRMNIA
jgi:cysteine desulfurase